jgi:hypothetical protein
MIADLLLDVIAFGNFRRPDLVTGSNQMLSCSLRHCRVQLALGKWVRLMTVDNENLAH